VIHDSVRYQSARRKFLAWILGACVVVISGCGSSDRLVELSYAPKDRVEAEQLARTVCKTASFRDFEFLAASEESATFNCQGGEVFVAVWVFFSRTSKCSKIRSMAQEGWVFKIGNLYAVTSQPTSNRGSSQVDLLGFSGTRGPWDSQLPYDIEAPTTTLQLSPAGLQMLNRQC
jgi:hypothetical protein